MAIDLYLGTHSPTTDAANVIVENVKNGAIGASIWSPAPDLADFANRSVVTVDSCGPDLLPSWKRDSFTTAAAIIAAIPKPLEDINRQITFVAADPLSIFSKDLVDLYNSQIENNLHTAVTSYHNEGFATATLGILMLGGAQVIRGGSTRRAFLRNVAGIVGMGSFARGASIASLPHIGNYFPSSLALAIGSVLVSDPLFNEDNWLNRGRNAIVAAHLQGYMEQTGLESGAILMGLMHADRFRNVVEFKEEQQYWIQYYYNQMAALLQKIGVKDAREILRDVLITAPVFGVDGIKKQGAAVSAQEAQAYLTQAVTFQEVTRTKVILNAIDAPPLTRKPDTSAPTRSLAQILARKTAAQNIDSGNKT